MTAISNRLPKVFAPAGLECRFLRCRIQRWSGVAMLLWLGPAASQGAELDPLLTQWLAAQTNLHSWKAEVVQTRRLKTLTQPLVAKGHVWFFAPNLFRWEIGQPASTIAIRQRERMLVVYPRLKRVEQFPLGESAQGPWKEILALLEAGFPRSRRDLDDRFEVLGHTVEAEADICTLRLQPVSQAARRMIPHLEVSFSTEDFSLRATELEFADGSTMHNEFHDASIDPELDQNLFQPEFPDDYQWVKTQVP